MYRQTSDIQGQIRWGGGGTGWGGGSDGSGNSGEQVPCNNKSDRKNTGLLIPYMKFQILDPRNVSDSQK